MLAGEIKGVCAFAYDTLYFDTPDLMNYLSHLQGRRRRFTRGTNDRNHCRIRRRALTHEWRPTMMSRRNFIGTSAAVLVWAALL